MFQESRNYKDFLHRRGFSHDRLSLPPTTFHSFSFPNRHQNRHPIRPVHMLDLNQPRTRAARSQKTQDIRVAQGFQHHRDRTIGLPQFPGFSPTSPWGVSAESAAVACRSKIGGNDDMVTKRAFDRGGSQAGEWEGLYVRAKTLAQILRA